MFEQPRIRRPCGPASTQPLRPGDAIPPPHRPALAQAEHASGPGERPGQHDLERGGSRSYHRSLARRRVLADVIWLGRRLAGMRGGTEIPLSFAQRRLWFLDRLEGSNPTHTIPIALRLTGGLDAAALAAALGDVVARHESLRTVFPDTQGTPRQLILEPEAARPRLAVMPVSEGGAGRGAGRGGAAGLRSRERAFRCGRICSFSARARHVLLLVLHHIAADGWSLAPLGRDLAAAYRARCRGQAADLPPLPVQYADYTLWQYEVLGREDDPDSAIARQLGFWTAALRELPDQLDLPTDRPRPGGVELSRRDASR